MRRPVYITAEPWPGLPTRYGNRRHKAADLAEATWPNLTGKLKPHDHRHTHSTWLDDTGVSKVIQMDRRGHAMQGMDRVYMHVTLQMRQRLCDALEDLWNQAITERHAISPQSTVSLLNLVLTGHVANVAANETSKLASIRTGGSP